MLELGVCSEGVAERLGLFENSSFTAKCWITTTKEVNSMSKECCVN